MFTANMNLLLILACNSYDAFLRKASKLVVRKKDQFFWATMRANIVDTFTVDEPINSHQFTQIRFCRNFNTICKIWFPSDHIVLRFRWIPTIILSRSNIFCQVFFPLSAEIKVKKEILLKYYTRKWPKACSTIFRTVKLI